jgi:uncharacterized tellurite resistance protein B-like protein
MEQLEHHVEQLALIAEILLGLAHADGFFLDEEGDKIRGLLEDFTEMSLPAPVAQRMAAFDPQTFDVDAACALLDAEGDNRRALLAMLMQVADADEVRDLTEERYIGRVIMAIGAIPDDLDGLV